MHTLLPAAAAAADHLIDWAIFSLGFNTKLKPLPLPFLHWILAFLALYLHCSVCTFSLYSLRLFKFVWLFVAPTLLSLTLFSAFLQLFLLSWICPTLSTLSVKLCKELNPRLSPPSVYLIIMHQLEKRKALSLFGVFSEIYWYAGLLNKTSITW